MLTKLFALVMLLLGLGIVGYVFVFRAINAIPLLLMAIAFILTSMWAGVWYGVSLIEQQIEESAPEIPKINIPQQRPRQ